MINLCQFEKFSCFGCCGKEFTTKKEIQEGIKKNTFEYLEYKDKKKFAERSTYLRASGICRNLIFKEKKIICPLHPSLNKGKELRDNLCDTDYLCESFKEFNKWDNSKRKEFIEFINSKNPDWYDYSINIDNGNYLKEFLKSKVNKG